MSRLLFLLSLAFVSACSEPPPCQTTKGGAVAPSAGCLVMHRGKLLLTEVRGGKFGPPGGSALEGEVAQCTAERETWEETGIAVKAGELATRFDNGFHLYWCEPQDSNPVPSISRPMEVTSVDFYDPESFETLNWRFPEQGVQIYFMVTQDTWRR